MVNYNNSIVYKLCCKDPEITDIYVGSTTDFTKRKWNHKSNCNNENTKKYNFIVYEFIRRHGNWENWDMIQIETYNADDKRDLESRERHWIELLKSSLNKTVPTQTAVEQKAKYYINNKEKIKKTHSEYYINNKEKIDKKIAEYDILHRDRKNVKVVCECGSEVGKYNLSRHTRAKKHIKYLELSILVVDSV